MRTLIDYFRLLSFFAGALLGVQLPGYVNQYGQNLAARHAESALTLQEFRRDAERHFGGDLQALIDHYRRSGDPVVTDGGESIATIYARFQRLDAALAAFRSSHWQAWWQAFVQPIPDVRDQVIEEFSYTVRLAPEAIGIGLLLGLVIAGMVESLTRGTCTACLRVFRGKPGYHPSRKPQPTPQRPAPRGPPPPSQRRTPKI